LTPSFEKTLWKKGELVVGIDEVGRGSLAGPLVAAGVLFTPDHRMIKGINDSKKLSSRERSRLFYLILNRARLWSVSLISPIEIDKIGIGKANVLAFQQIMIDLKCSMAVIDGRDCADYHTVEKTRVEAFIKGDQKIYSIAAASILAKVYRDSLMCQLDRSFGEYYWMKNKGYGTRKHIEAIEKHGLTPYHRKSFCGKCNLPGNSFN